MDSSAGERSWAGFVVPALVTLLLGVQFFLGFRGFDRPDGGLWGLLEAPGALLGWGGVVILAVLLGWLVAGLVGRDLFGLQGPSGLVVRLIGCVALGLALSGVVGLLGGRAAGGEVGAGIGRLLGDSLGGVASVVLLVLMAIPALVLSLSPFFTTGPRTGPPGGPVSMDALSDLEPKPGLYEGTTTYQPKPLYPERRFDEDGNEIPMSFDARDVGRVRYADEEPDPDARVGPIKPEPVPVPDDDALADGVRFADAEAEEEGPARPEAVDANDARIPLADGVRYADEPEPEPEPEDDDEPEPEPADEGEGDDDEGGGAPTGAEEDEDEATIEDEAPPPPPRPRRPSPPAAPAVAPTPVSGPPPPEVTGADALDQLRDEDEGARYRAKLEGSGMFDEAPTPAAPPAPAAPAARPAAKKRPAARKKKPAAKKKAATAKKTSPSKKPAAPRGTKPTPAKTKAPAKKKAAPRKRPAPDPEPPAEAPIEEAPRRKGAGATGPQDEVYRKAVAVAMERSAASSVLLSRRLGIGYAQARSLIELLVKDGILGEMTPSGSRPLLITEDEWAERTSS